MAQVALAWSMSKEGLSAPIVGTTSLENLRDLIGKFLSFRLLSMKHILTILCDLGAVNVTLTDEEIKYLDEPYKPMPLLH